MSTYGKTLEDGKVLVSSVGPRIGKRGRAGRGRARVRRASRCRGPMGRGAMRLPLVFKLVEEKKLMEVDIVRWNG